MSFVIRLCAKGFVFYAQDQIIEDIYFLSLLFVFMPRIKLSGTYTFCLFCLSACRSDVNFNLRYNFWTLGDFIFGLHTPLRFYLQIKQRVDDFMTLGAMVAEWLSSWLAGQEVRGSIPGLATWISEIGYLLIPSRDMAEIPLKRRKSSI